MPIPQRGIASVYAVHTAGALSVWSPVNFRNGSRAKVVLTTPRNSSLGSAHEAQGRVCSPREIFSVNADRRRWQSVFSVATDCVVDLRVALPSIYPYRQGRAPPVLNLLAAGQILTTAKTFMHG